MRAAALIAIARRTVGSLRAATAGQRWAGRWGLHVGQTGRDADTRFDQHKAGYKASGAVRWFGVRLLPHAVAHLGPLCGWEAVEPEAALADALRAAGVGWLEGGH